MAAGCDRIIVAELADGNEHQALGSAALEYRVPIIGDERNLSLLLDGYGLTTAEFLYHMPDHPHVLQTFVWQDYDLAPKFPEPVKIHRVLENQAGRPAAFCSYTHKRLIAPNECVT